MPPFLFKLECNTIALGLPTTHQPLCKAHEMPYVNLQITKGATREQKAQLVKDITDSLVRVLGKKPEHTHIVIQEINEEDWGYAGLLTDEWKAKQTA
jgi:4-oxalocrotonate tautomerase